MLLTNAVLWTEEGFAQGPDIRLENGFVAAFGRLSPLPGEPVRDLKGDYLIPGFVDVHIHAYQGHDTMRGEEDIRFMARGLRETGVSAFCPTTMSASLEDTKKAVAAVRQVRLFPKSFEARVLGAHMEAPFLSPKKAGAQQACYFSDPSWELFEQMTGGHPEDVRLMTLAPERPGAEAFVKKAVSQGLRISVGHTDADAGLTHQAADWGADHATHLFNAQPPLHHRSPGVPGAVLTDERFFAEMICDGVHLHRDTVRLICACKGASRAVAITDAMEAAGMPDGDYSLGGQRVIVHGSEARLADGTLAGSVLTMPRALSNLIHRFSIDPWAAVRMCTAAPADSIGESLLGRLLPGSPAPLTRWTPDWRLSEVIG